MPASEFRESKETDEIWRNGKLYDIAGFTISNDTAIVSVYHDNNEESLVYQIAESFEPNESCSSDNIVHLIKHKIHLPDNSKLVAYCNFDNSVVYIKQISFFVHLPAFCSTFHGSVPVPPPNTYLV